MQQLPLRPRAAFADRSSRKSDGQGIRVTEREDIGIATVLARKGQHAALKKRVLDRFGIELPAGPRRAHAGDVSLIGTGPGAWLAIADGRANTFAASLRDATLELASMSDQSDGYAVLRLEGPKVREVLGKLVFIDLHDQTFDVGQAASTAASHIGAILWRLEDASDGSPVFEIAVYRSYAESFWHALCECAAEFGMTGA